MTGPKPIAELPVTLCRNLKVFFCDIDDTITAGGLLTAQSFGALWQLHDTGIEVVPVTGLVRPHRPHVAGGGGDRGKRRLHLQL